MTSSPECGISTAPSRFHTASSLRAYARSRLVRHGKRTHPGSSMATIPPLRPLDNGPDEPGAVLRGASPVKTAAAIAAAAAVFLLVVVIAGVGRLDADVSFLEDALGPEAAEAPMERTPAPGVDVRINAEGYTVSHWGASV